MSHVLTMGLIFLDKLLTWIKKTKVIEVKFNFSIDELKNFEFV
jgi:hypothetical protein